MSGASGNWLPNSGAKSIQSKRAQHGASSKWSSKPETTAPNKNLSISTSNLNVDEAVAHLIAGAPDNVSKHHCWRSVREAIEQGGGVKFKTRPGAAKDAGAALVEIGFSVAELSNYREKKGDVAIIQNYDGGSKEGHACMFTGKKWISDFIQIDMWSGPGYRTNKPPYKIYRPKN